MGKQATRAGARGRSRPTAPVSTLIGREEEQSEGGGENVEYVRDDKSTASTCHSSRGAKERGEGIERGKSKT
jgi:hypothetical protein